jgi:alpha-L-arabinofuranosidase
MRGGVSVRVALSSPKFEGETLPTWISDIKGQPSVLDASAVLHVSESGEESLRIAVVNRSELDTYRVPIHVAFIGDRLQGGLVEVHELWHEDVGAKNGWGKENEVAVRTSQAKWSGEWTFREHSFTLLIITFK